MTNPNWPPKVYNILTKHLNNPNIGHAIFRFYCKLLALAWGKSSFEIPVAELMKAVDLEMPTLKAYAKALDQQNALRWSCGHASFKCEFIGLDISDLKNADRAYIDSLSSKTPLKPVSRKAKNKSADLKNSDRPPKATTREITDAYVKLLGYDPGDWAQGESKAAKWIGEHYTTAEFSEAYKHYKANKFWSDKRLTLRNLKTQIAEYFSAKNKGQIKGVAAIARPMTDAEVEAEIRRLNPGVRL